MIRNAQPLCRLSFFLLLFPAIPAAASIPWIYPDSFFFLRETGAVRDTDPYPNSGTPSCHPAGPLIREICSVGGTLEFGDLTPRLPRTGSEAEFTVQGKEDVDIFFDVSAVPGAEVYAFGFEYEGSGTPTSFEIVLLEQGVEVGRHQLGTSGFSNSRFLGLWSPVPFDAVEIREDETTPGDEYFGPMYVGLRVLDSRRRLTDDDLGASSVAIDTKHALVGAPSVDTGGADSGAAFLFHRDEGGDDLWGRVKTVGPLDPAAGALFGSSVAIQDDIIVVGASGDAENGLGAGAVYVFRRDQGGSEAWGQVAKLTAADGAAGDEFGAAVGITGNWIMVGAPGADAVGVDSGAMYAFGRNTGGPDAWGEVHKITGSDTSAGDDFGRSLAVEGDVAIVGAPLNLEPGYGPFTYSGSAFVFGARIGGPGVWGESQKLLPAGRIEVLRYGEAVAISGSRALVSAPRTNTQTEVDFAHGAVYVLEQDTQGVWTTAFQLTGDDNGHRFGESVALDGDLAVIRAGGVVSGPDEIFFRRFDPSYPFPWIRERSFNMDERSTSVAIGDGNVLVGAVDEALLFLPFLFRDGFETGKLSRWGQQ